MEDSNLKGKNTPALLGFIFSLTFLSIPGLILSIIGLCTAKRYRARRTGLAIAGLIISALTILLFAIFVIIPGDSNSTGSSDAPRVAKSTVKKSKKKAEDLKDIEIIDFSTLNEDTALDWCDDNNINCVIETQYSDDYAAGSLISQSVAAGEIIKEESKLKVVYSLGHKKTEEEIKEEEKAAFKASCQRYTYEEISRNPENYKGKPAVFTGEVIQVQEERMAPYIVATLRVDVTKNEYGWYDDTVYVTYVFPEGDPRILEKDIITMYGTLNGLKSYTSILGATITIPDFNAKYIER